jgi:hypothetical protein
MDPDEPIWSDLGSPRALSADESRVLLELAAAVDEPLLHRQVRAAVVTAACRCGCSSVRLSSPKPAVPAARVAQLFRRDGAGGFSVAATGPRPGAADVQVVLHVGSGRVQELEVFLAEGEPVSLTDVTVLTGVILEWPGQGDRR